MKTPDEIKESMQYGIDESFEIYDDESYCPGDVEVGFISVEDLEAALAYIKQLEVDKVSLLESSHEMRKEMISKIKQLEADLEIQEIKRNAMFAKAEQLDRERDFLLGYLTNTHMAPCDICKHEPETHDINDCAHIRKVGLPCFEWRGLPEV